MAAPQSAASASSAAAMAPPLGIRPGAAILTESPPYSGDLALSAGSEVGGPAS